MGITMSDRTVIMASTSACCIDEYDDCQILVVGPYPSLHSLFASGTFHVHLFGRNSLRSLPPKEKLRKLVSLSGPCWGATCLVQLDSTGSPKRHRGKRMRNTQEREPTPPRGEGAQTDFKSALLYFLRLPCTCLHEHSRSGGLQ